MEGECLYHSGFSRGTESMRDVHEEIFKKDFGSHDFEAENPVICPLQTGNPGKLVVLLEGLRVRE